VRLLASVRSVNEAEIAARCGAAIVDCKDPVAGALGALPLATVGAVRRALAPAIPVSATIGDLPCEPASVAEAVTRTAATGVEFVKVGLFPGRMTAATIARLGALRLGRARLVGVLLADLGLDLALVGAMARARFAGAMLDTAAKGAGGLLDCVSTGALGEFITSARNAGLFAGLAGSLRLGHIPELAVLRPDVLGFRGALCRKGQREEEIDPVAVRAVRRAILAAAGTLVPDCETFEERPV
jgi:uncharacterized protein (UPF0264 family)